MAVSVRFEDNTPHFLAAIRRAASSVTAAEVDDMVADARSRTPVRSGALRESITSTLRDTGDGVEAEVGSELDYAPAVHEGLTARMVVVRAHTRVITQAFGRPIPPTTVHVGSYTMRMASRPPTKFIEGALRAGSDRLRSDLEGTLAREAGS